MKKETAGKDRLTIIFSVLFIVLFCLKIALNCSAAWPVQIDKPVIRLHVKAAGDSPEEQQFKMLLVARLQQLFHNKSIFHSGDYGVCLNFIEGYLSGLEKELQRVADETAGGLPIAVRLSRENFPLRTYGRRIYPAGSYTTLLVTVGEGNGENWWCLLFPPLCLPPAEVNDEATGFGGDPSNKSENLAIPDAKPESETGDTVRWRSKIWDLLRCSGQYFIEKARQIFYN